ncbi:c-type cytochrome [Pseudomonas sp. MAP12]|uniref:C-type cytochrome n=1 Tax=Geopseudomonas aromaticivorans TaxID=2849492 RepID=A0ABS6MW90_9GAMM|nr:cytochrome c [Pseudomonas aromaticivorans]MBV2133059.1 c-type cytochrome [Pseudomonas aromaticivorans]
MRALLLLLALLPAMANAAELLVELADGSHRYSSAELLAHPASRELEIPADVAYKRAMHYRAVPLAELLEGVKAEDHLQAVADDGFAAELPAAALLDAKGARAWLAVEDPAKPWPALGKAGKSAGPFYLVWTHPEAEQIGAEQWPFRMVRLRILAPVAERFPALRPDPALAVDDPINLGFAQFQKNCLACHRLNKQGDAAFGPDLNLPYNPTEYLRADLLRRYIRDPQSLRHWPQARMPGFAATALSEDQLDHLLAYLRHMAGRKVAAD